MYINFSNKKAQYIYIYIAIALIQLAAYLLNYSVIGDKLLSSFGGGADGAEVFGSLGVLLGEFSMSYPITALVIAALIFALSTLILEQQIVKYNLTGKISLTPIMLLICYAASIGSSTPPLIVSIYLFAMLCSIYYTISRRKEQARSTSKLLLSAVMLGVLPLIYNAAIVAIFMLIPIKIMVTNRDRDLLTLLIGFLTPTFIALHLDYLINSVDYLEGIQNIYKSILTPSGSMIFEPLSGLILVIIGGGATIYTMVRINAISLPAISRIYLIIFALYIAVAIFMIFLPSFSIGALAMLSVPFTIFTSMMLSHLNKWYTIALAAIINLVAILF